MLITAHVSLSTKELLRGNRTMKCGFIGLGSQGGPMARRIVDAGFDLVLWARRPESLEPYRDTAASVAESVADLGGQVDYCGVCVVDDDGVTEVVEQLLTSMQPGSVIVIHSTVTPKLCIKLAARAAQVGVDLLDAPVSGGGPGAAAGTLTVMIGGKKAVAERVQVVLDTFAGAVSYLGGVGAGQYAKLVNNTMMAANLATANHAIVVAAELGIELDAFKELVKQSSGRSFAFDVRARMSAPKDFAHGAKLLAKDVALLGDALADDSQSYEAIAAMAKTFLDVALGE
jgi:3-hydroxyisobutyrate dehydrogenase